MLVTSFVSSLAQLCDTRSEVFEILKSKRSQVLVPFRVVFFLSPELEKRSRFCSRLHWSSLHLCFSVPFPIKRPQSNLPTKSPPFHFVLTSQHQPISPLMQGFWAQACLICWVNKLIIHPTKHITNLPLCSWDVHVDLFSYTLIIISSFFFLLFFCKLILFTFCRHNIHSPLAEFSCLISRKREARLPFHNRGFYSMLFKSLP